MTPVLRFTPVAVCLLGLVVYAMASTEKPKEAGRLAYFAGLLAALLTVAHGAL